ncbi:MAG: UDP-N-acetylmuramoyl-tripeptide--D-alanyl-D-alanine ligase [Oscillospiraceae bacterium]|nr:UDP-N-acetylmuramoyl-tripeptide--D-alanyl-D-alanine ligase [Oscillospiraceae bacterium]
MKYLTPQIIADITGGTYVGDDSSRNIRIQGAERDHRNIQPQNLFICIKGARVDGHSFANSAFESGAACCLTQEEIPDAKGPYVIVDSTLLSIREIGAYYRSLFDIPFIGLTGSVGKTTAKELVAAALSAKFHVLKTRENLNNDLGVPLTLLSLDETHEAAVIEMGISDFGDMSILAQMVRPDIFIMTKIGYAHLEELGDLNGVLKAKTEAFAYMKPDGIAVMNGDDELLRSYDTKRKTITFGLEEHNDFRAADIHAQGTDAVTFDILSDTGKFHVFIPSYGSHLPALAPAAAVIGRLLGMTDEEISHGLKSYAPVGGRSNASFTGTITLIDDCYNANPNSVKAALSSLSSLTGRRIAILGDMLNLGTDSDQLHYDVGVFAAQCGVDYLICGGDKASLIYDGFKSISTHNACYYPDKKSLLEVLPDLIKKDDTVLVKASNGMQFSELLPILRQI